MEGKKKRERSEKKGVKEPVVSNRMAQMCMANSAQNTEELEYLQFYVKSVEQDEHYTETPVIVVR